MALYIAEVAETMRARGPLAYRLAVRVFCGARVQTSRPSSNRQNNKSRMATVTGAGVRVVNSASRGARGLTSEVWRSVVAKACSCRTKRTSPPPPPTQSPPRDARPSRACTVHQAMASSARPSRTLAAPAPASSGGPSARPSSSYSRSRRRRRNAVEVAPLVAMPASAMVTAAAGSEP